MAAARGALAAALLLAGCSNSVTTPLAYGIAPRLGATPPAPAGWPAVRVAPVVDERTPFPFSRHGTVVSGFGDLVGLDTHGGIHTYVHAEVDPPEWIRRAAAIALHETGADVHAALPDPASPDAAEVRIALRELWAVRDGAGGAARGWVRLGVAVTRGGKVVASDEVSGEAGCGGDVPGAERCALEGALSLALRQLLENVRVALAPAPPAPEAEALAALGGEEPASGPASGPAAASGARAAGAAPDAGPEGFPPESAAVPEGLELVSPRRVDVDTGVGRRVVGLGFGGAGFWQPIDGGAAAVLTIMLTVPLLSAIRADASFELLHDLEMNRTTRYDLDVSLGVQLPPSGRFHAIGSLGFGGAYGRGTRELPALRVPARLGLAIDGSGGRFAFRAELAGALLFDSGPAMLEVGAVATFVWYLTRASAR